MAWSGVDLTLAGSINGGPASNSHNTGPVGAVAADTIVIVQVVLDNNATVDGDNGEVTSVTDPKGNQYFKAKEFTNSQGAAGGGCTVSLWYSQLDTALEVNDAVTANFSFSPVWKGVRAGKADVAAGNSVRVTAVTDLANDAADPGSLDLSVANIEHLWVRFIAKEGGVGTYTRTVDYGFTATALGSGTDDDTRIAMAGEADIFTGTTNPSDPTWTTSARDHASVLVAFEETTTAATNLGRRKSLFLEDMTTY